MQRFEYGYEDGLRGVEAKILINDNNQMFIKIVGSNHWRDYLENLLAWPRVRPVDDKKVKTHRVWTRQAWGLSVFVNDLIEKYGIEHIEIIGHSSGGAVCHIMPLFLPITDEIYIGVRSINSPKIGNESADKKIRRSCFYTSLFDEGDIVRMLPLLYSESKEEEFRYDSTKPFWKAHNNMPGTWKTFPV